jgi:hypothetical protein
MLACMALGSTVRPEATSAIACTAEPTVSIKAASVGHSASQRAVDGLSESVSGTSAIGGVGWFDGAAATFQSARAIRETSRFKGFSANC